MKQKFNKEVALKIISMAHGDQKLRKKLKSLGAWKKSDWKKVEKTDIEHTNVLKDIVNKYGWPTIPRVGKEANKST